MVIDNRFEISQEVYLKTDIDQKKRIITGLIITKNDIRYELASGVESTWHYDYEVSLEINVLITV